MRRAQRSRQATPSETSNSERDQPSTCHLPRLLAPRRARCCRSNARQLCPQPENRVHSRFVVSSRRSMATIVSAARDNGQRRAGKPVARWMPATAKPTTTTVGAAEAASSHHIVEETLPDIPTIACRAQGASGPGGSARHRDEARRQGTPVGRGSYPDGRTRITLGCAS